MPVTLVSQNLTSSQAVNVTYQISAPSGSNWAATDAGNYSVALAANSVKDTAGSALQGGSFGTIQLTVSAPPVVNGLTVQPVTTLPAAVVGGSKIKGGIKVTLTNTTGANIDGLVSVNAYVSLSDNTLNGAIPLGTLTRHLKLKMGKSKIFIIKGKNLNYPTASADYFLLTSADVNGVADSAIGHSSAAVTVAQPFVDLATSNVTPINATIASGKSSVVVLTVTNNGNTSAADGAAITISLTANGVNTQIGAGREGHQAATRQE